MTPRRIAAFGLVLVLGIAIGSMIRKRADSRHDPNWPKEAPTTVIVSYPTGTHDRTAHLLNVSRIAPSHDGRAPKWTWRVVLTTTSGTWYIEGDHVSAETVLDD